MQPMKKHTASMNSTPRRQRGFSLLELVAAFLVFALGFGALMQILSSSLRNARLSAEYTQAALWAQSKLDIAGVGEKLQEGSSRGEFDKRYRWELEVSRYDPPEATSSTGLQTPAQAGVVTPPSIDLFRLDLAVSWGGPLSERSAHFTTLRAANPDPNVAMGTAAPLRPRSRANSTRKE
jgi:general secretion pathway protein I